MNGYWAIVKKWLFPGWKVTLPLAAVSAAALYAVFTCGLEGTPLAYAAYLVSFYALVAATGLAVRVCRPAWRWICGIFCEAIDALDRAPARRAWALSLSKKARLFRQRRMRAMQGSIAYAKVAPHGA